MSKQLLILGSGTAGTMAANRLRRALPRSWSVTVVDRDDHHLYQPGLLLLPFDTYRAEQLVRSRHAFVGDGIELFTGEVGRVDAPASTVHLSGALVVRDSTGPAPALA